MQYEEVMCCVKCGVNLTQGETDAHGELCEDCAYDASICPNCDGTGEGMYDGAHCSRCHGTGRTKLKSDDYDY